MSLPTRRSRSKDKLMNDTPPPSPLKRENAFRISDEEVVASPVVSLPRAESNVGQVKMERDMVAADLRKEREDIQASVKRMEEYRQEARKKTLAASVDAALSLVKEAHALLKQEPDAFSRENVLARVKAMAHTRQLGELLRHADEELQLVAEDEKEMLGLYHHMRARYYGLRSTQGQAKDMATEAHMRDAAFALDKMRQLFASLETISVQKQEKKLFAQLLTEMYKERMRPVASDVDTDEEDEEEDERSDDDSDFQ